MTIGTCYFPSYGAALRHYRPYCVTEGLPNRSIAKTVTVLVRAMVDQKLNASEIHIGKPVLKPGQTLSIQDNRYHVTDPK